MWDKGNMVYIFGVRMILYKVEKRIAFDLIEYLKIIL